MASTIHAAVLLGCVLYFQECNSDLHDLLPSYCVNGSIYNPSSGHCYKFIQKDVTWETAESACASMMTANSSAHVHLVTIDSYAEAIFLSVFPREKLRSKYTWINYHYFGGKIGWSRRDCTPQEYIPRGSVHTFHGGPVEGYCGLANVLSNLWSAKNCSSLFPTLCEIVPGQEEKPVIERSHPSCLWQNPSNDVSLPKPLIKITTERVKSLVINMPNMTSSTPHKKGLSLVINRHRKSVMEDSDKLKYGHDRRKRRSFSGIITPLSMLGKISKTTDGTVKMINYTKVSNLSTVLHMTGYAHSDILSYKVNNTLLTKPTPELAHVVIAIMSIVVFVILIGGLCIIDLKSMIEHVIQGEEGRLQQENQTLSSMEQITHLVR